MSNFVFVIDSDKKPLDPCNPARARILLSKGRAAVFRRFPFTIILKYPVDVETTQEYQVKLDPNATRWKLFNTLKEFGLPVAVGSGGRTKYNRIRFQLKKDHWIDAACTGKTENLYFYTNKPLIIKAKEHGSRQMVRMNKYGFPASSPKQKIPDWKTGDFVTVVKGKNAGLQGVRLKTVRFKGNFDIWLNGKILSVSRNHICKSFSADGYDYQF